jgi:hypothetical protein
MDRQAELLGRRTEQALRDELERIERLERDAGVPLSFQTRMDIQRRLRLMEGRASRDEQAAQRQSSSSKSCSAAHPIAASVPQSRRTVTIDEAVNAARHRIAAARAKNAAIVSGDGAGSGRQRRGKNADIRDAVAAARRRVNSRNLPGESVCEVLARAHEDLNEIRRGGNAATLRASGARGAARLARVTARELVEGEPGAEAVLRSAEDGRRQVGGEEDAELSSGEESAAATAALGPEEDQMCNVCWERTGPSRCLLDCPGHHVFCIRCVVRWFQGKNPAERVCPCCKQLVYTVFCRRDPSSSEVCCHV